MPKPVAAGLAIQQTRQRREGQVLPHAVVGGGRAAVPPKPTDDMLSNVSAAACASSRVAISAVGS